MHTLYIVVIPPTSSDIAEAVANIMRPLCHPQCIAPEEQHTSQSDNFYWVTLSPKRIASYEGILGVTSQEFPRFVAQLKAYRGYLEIKQGIDGHSVLIKREYWFDYYQIGGHWGMRVPNNYAIVKDLPDTLKVFGLVTPEREVVTQELAKTLTGDEAQGLQGYDAFQSDTNPYKVFHYVPGIDKDPHIWNSEYRALLDEYAHYLGVIIDVHT